MTIEELSAKAEEFCREHHPGLLDADAQTIAKVMAYRMIHVCTLMNRICQGQGYTKEEFVKDAANTILCAQVLCNKLDVSLADAIEEALTGGEKWESI